MLNLKHKALALALTLGVSGGAIGETQGGLGTHNPSTGASQGSFDITFNQNALTRIWGLGDVNLTPGSLANASQDVCVYSNADTNGSYQLEVASGNASNLFTLIDSNSTDTIPYAITFTHGGQTLTADENSTGVVSSTAFDAGALATQPDPGTVGSPTTGCASKENLNIAVAITAPTPGGAVQVQDGTYTDTITVTVSPI